MMEIWLLSIFLILLVSTWGCIVLYKLEEIKEMLEAEG